MAFMLIFVLIVRKFLLFVDAQGVQSNENTVDVSLYFMEISCSYYCPLVALNITAPNTLNIGNM